MGFQTVCLRQLVPPYIPLGVHGATNFWAFDDFDIKPDLFLDFPITD